MVTGRRVLVLTVVHPPWDARIRARQIEALLRAGWQVTYAAPWSGYDLPLPGPVPGLTCLDVTRARGRRRIAAQRAARRLLRQHAPDHDVVLLHDPELVVCAVGLGLPNLVWDVHEDTAAAVQVRSWLPTPVRRPLAFAVRVFERLAERRLPLLLADARYADRFTRPHPVVPNTTWVQPDPPPAAVPDDDGAYRVVYLGAIAPERGAAQLVQVARSLRRRAPGLVRVEVIGMAHGAATQQLLGQAQQDGDLTWHGPLANEEALGRVDGALAGLCLLHDEANFRPSMPTKVVEYLARGVPVITTPLPVARDLVLAGGGGVVVPFGDVEEVVETILGWAHAPELARQMGRQGHALVHRQQNWSADSALFLAALEDVVAAATE